MPGRKHLAVRVEVSTPFALLVQSGPGAASILATNTDTDNAAKVKAIQCVYMVELEHIKTTPLL